ncbi:hypothetical protein ABEF93_004765 [Exophiala dermatitidis]
MDSAPALHRCTRCVLSLSQSSTRTIIRTARQQQPSQHQQHQFQPLLIQSARQFSTSQGRHDAPSPPSPQPASASSEQASSKPAPARPSIKDLLRDLRAKEDVKSGGQSVSERMDALMGRRQDGGRASSFADIMGRGRGGAGDRFDQTKILDELSQELHETSSISLRLRPTLGRTVDALNGDASKGFRILERKCADNKVRQDARKQLFHVRRGQYKKDLRRQRWRKLFLEGFIAECGRIRRMRKQGW